MTWLTVLICRWLEMVCVVGAFLFGFHRYSRPESQLSLLAEKKAKVTIDQPLVLPGVSAIHPIDEPRRGHENNLNTILSSSEDSSDVSSSSESEYDRAPFHNRFQPPRPRQRQREKIAVTINDGDSDYLSSSSSRGATNLIGRRTDETSSGSDSSDDSSEMLNDTLRSSSTGTLSESEEDGQFRRSTWR